jgi:hypothetical protein
MTTPAHHIPRRLGAALCCTAILLTVGCSSRPHVEATWTPNFSDPAITPSGWTPPPSTTPTRTPTATPTPGAWTATPTQPDLYDQAFAVYNTFYRGYVEAQVAGGIDDLSEIPELNETLTGRAAARVLATLSYRKNNLTWDGLPQFRVSASQPITDGVPDGTLVGLMACEDTWGAATYNKAGQEVSDDGTFTEVHAYYFQKNDQGALVIFETGMLPNSSDDIGGDTCPINQ